MFRLSISFGLILSFLAAGRVLSQDSQKSPAYTELPGYHTVATAITTQPKRQTTSSGTVQPGYLGVFVESDKDGHVVVADVAAESPAAKAGLTAGDVVSQLGEEAIKTADQFRSLLLGRSPGDLIKLAVLRGTESKTLEATMAA